MATYAELGRPLPQKRNELPPEPQIQIITERQARVSGVAQPQYLATNLDVSRIQNALRTAERGDTWQLFTIFRDMVTGYGHLTAEWAKRKSVITGNPEALVPYDPENADDVVACEVIKQMIDGCRNWFDALNHLLDATLYPLAVCEKIYEPVPMSEAGLLKHPLRMRLKELAPVDPVLLCFKVPYQPGLAGTAQDFNPDDWEAWLRFYTTMPGGNINFASANTYKPKPSVHIVHRGNMLSPTIAPNFGGHMRTILFWWLLATQDRDWWALMMQKYGMPIPVVKADTTNKDTIALMQQALQFGMQMGGLVIDKKAAIEWGTVAGTDGSTSHKIFNEFCNAEVSKIVIGQTLSSKPSPTGMGSGASEQSEDIRDDIRQQDSMKLRDTLRKQVFTDFLRVNGYRGNAPMVYWGGMRSNDAMNLSRTLQTLGAGGYELDDPAMVTVSNRFGYGIRRREIQQPVNGGDRPKDINK